MIHRAEYYLRKFDGRQINLLWSGGIDTTAVICAFLHVIKRDNLDPN